MQASMGLSYFSSITSHFLTSCTGWFSIYFLLRDNENNLKFAMRHSTKFQRVVEPCQHIRKHIANAFQNNNSALGSVSNRLKNVKCIFQGGFNLSLMPGFCK